jgi:Neuraminidase (sialidase)
VGPARRRFGPTLFSRTTDSGRTWEPARVIYDPGASRQTLNNQVVVLPDGTLVCTFTHFILSGPVVVSTTLMAIRSTDKGVTWSRPIVISSVQARGATDPESGAGIRDGATLGSIAAGRNGQIAIVWQDARFSGGRRDGIAFSRSLDGGLTWSAPVQINRVPEVQAFLPTVHIRNDGTIGVSYFDFRSNTPDPRS